MAKASEADALYDDKFVRVTKRGLQIKWYYFPTAQSRHVDLESVKGVYYETQARTSWLAVKSWGQALSAAW